MNGAEFILHGLAEEGIDHLFAVPGGLVDPFFLALEKQNRVTPIIACHEGGAAYMADGYARMTGGLGAFLCIGGPGITNAVTALSSSLCDQIPVMAITGQVPLDWQGLGGFQDSSHAGLNEIQILRGAVQSQLVVNSSNLLPHHFRELALTSFAHPKAPSHLAVPKNIQQASCKASYTKIDSSLKQTQVVEAGVLEKFWKEVNQNQRIVILTGSATNHPEAAAELAKFAETYSIPVATTLNGKGSFPEDHPLSVGVFGYAGHPHAIETILSDEVDVLIVLGAELNQRNTLFWNRDFQPKKSLIQIDINPAAIGLIYPTSLPIVSDASGLLKHLNQELSNGKGLAQTKPIRDKWIQAIKSKGVNVYNAGDLESDAVPIHPARLVAAMRKVAPRSTPICIDSGAHRAFASHYFHTYEPQRFFQSTNIGAMGWAIPAAVGVHVAKPDVPCLVATGDGCMRMHGMEIQVAARYGLNIKYVVFNNDAYANVYLRQKKASINGGKLTCLPHVDWAGYARALGVKGITVTQPHEIESALEEAFTHQGPCLVDVVCDRDVETPVAPYYQINTDWMDHE